MLDHGLTPFQVSADPELIAELRPNFETVYAGLPVRTNGAGFRGAEFPAPRPGVHRIALIGDSYVFGSGVEEESTLGAVLERRLVELGVPCQVLSCGVPGYTAPDVARMLEARVLGERPDQVLYVNFANDLDHVAKYESIPADSVIDAMRDFRLRSAAIEYGIQIARRVGWRFGRHVGRDHTSAIEALYRGEGGDRVRGAIARMRTACAEHGIPYQVVIYPHLTVPSLDPLRTADECLLAEAPSLGVEAIDLLPAFGGERDLTRYWIGAFDTHPNAEGHGRAGRYLAEELLRRGLVERP